MLAMDFLFVILLSTSGVYPVEGSPSSMEGTCSYGLTTIAAFSCVQPDRAWLSPSLTCCRALLHAIDDVPAIGESGACCLCRYMRAKYPSARLAKAYVLCKGTDSHTVAKWSSFPIRHCALACKKSSIPSLDKGTSHKDRPVRGIGKSGNGIFKVLWLAAVVVVVMVLLLFWYFWKFKSATNASELRRRSLLLEGDQRGERRQSSTLSSTQLKGRRLSMSRSSPNN